jgi:metallo-beta-lactamase family protein
LHELFEAGKIPRVPVYVDSPLAVSATEIYRLHPDAFNQDIYEALFDRDNPFGFDNLTLIRSMSGSKALNDLQGTAIIISASGMCEAGRILHHLKNHIEKPSTTILFVGYCAANTLGRRIRDGHEQVSIFGESYDVKAKVEIVDSFSGHADHSELIQYYEAISGSKQQTWLVHGDPECSEVLQNALQSISKASKVGVAELGKTIEF